MTVYDCVCVRNVQCEVPNKLREKIERTMSPGRVNWVRKTACCPVFN